jgi:hypothetical protein
MKTFREIVEIQSKNMNGTCYVDAYNYFGNNYNKKLKLVHGLVTGQGAIDNIVYNHAWCEDDKNVYDPSHQPILIMSKKIYYTLGKINNKNVFKYNHSKMIEKSMEYETYGPWETKLLNNKY